ncbi:NAD(P)/FAD-dependent oxidoreductase [Microbaculum marinum]|uniref:NAD(P)/FAD-dependent oxidoreductase n=1 Tax=Microbaculum marinum TaxID=1764581 RepID=A0AAW9S3Q6_9HYPH
MNKPVRFESACVSKWLDRFEEALQATNREKLEALFLEDSHWRDMLALTWTMVSHDGRDAIVEGLLRTQPQVHPRQFQIATGRMQPRAAVRLGMNVIEAVFSFETDSGRCHGVLRLPSDDPTWAWVISTSLTELKGHEEPINERRPHGADYSRNFGSANWADLRSKKQAFSDREPAVLVIGGSQFGLTLAARLGLLDVDTLVVERTARIGDVWRNRYHSLALHNQVGKNHLPYIPFPPNWPRYISKDMLAGFIEFYGWAMDCNVWTSTEFLEGSFDEQRGTWNARIRQADGTERILRPRHLVFANGVSGEKKTPSVPGLNDFKGEVVHTADYHSGEQYRDKRAIVIGTGTSGHDCAQDLYGHGAKVKLVQRGSTTIIGLDAAATGDAAYLNGELSMDDADLFSVTATFALQKEAFRENTERCANIDRELLDSLKERGFKIDFGPYGAGHQMKLRARHGGYYINCGCSDLIVSGDIGLLQWDDAERFVEDGLLMRDGRVEKADLVVTATGYHTQQELVARLLGREIADRVGPIWGLDDEGELRNMFKPTPQRGLWFLGGGLSQNRIYSKYVALQIKAQELGLMD